MLFHVNEPRKSKAYWSGLIDVFVDLIVTSMAIATAFAYTNYLKEVGGRLNRPLLLPIILTVLTFLSTMLAIKLRPGCVDTGDNRFKKKIRSIEEQFERFN